MKEYHILPPIRDKNLTFIPKPKTHEIKIPAHLCILLPPQGRTPRRNRNMFRSTPSNRPHLRWQELPSILPHYHRQKVVRHKALLMFNHHGTITAVKNLAFRLRLCPVPYTAVSVSPRCAWGAGGASPKPPALPGALSVPTTACIFAYNHYRLCPCSTLQSPSLRSASGARGVLR